MNMFTKVSGKGQVVVPKAMRDLKGWPVGTDLEVVDAGDGVLLRPRRPEKTLTVDEAVARLRSIVRYDGPRLDETDWQRGIDDSIKGKLDRQDGGQRDR